METRSPRRFIGTALAVLVLSRASLAADPVTAQMEWLGVPEGCVDTAALEQSVEARLGRRVFVPPPTLFIRARFTTNEGRGDDVHLDVRDASGRSLGERDLSAASCEDVRASLPVVIAVLVDTAASEKERADTPATPVRPSKEATNKMATPRSQRTPRRTVAVAVLGGGLVGVEPRVAGGFGAEAFVALLPRLDLFVWGDFWFPSTTSGAPALSLGSASVGGGACARVVAGVAVEAGACAGAGALHLNEHVDDLARPVDDARWVAEARALVSFGYRLAGPLTARAEAGVLLPLTRPRYFYRAGVKDVDLFQLGWGGIGRIGLFFAFE